MKCFSPDAQLTIADWIAEKLSRRLGGSESFAFCYPYRQNYLPDQPIIDLVAVLHVDNTARNPTIYVSIIPHTSTAIAAINSLAEDLGSIRDFLRRQGMPLLKVTSPWELEPVDVPKPWGRELWFTGVEARGQAGIRAEGGMIPLPWVLHLFPQSAESAVILLKVLDPLPDEVYGDLYFELHEQKQEVYVVTHVSPSAWPHGIGGIQLGFSVEKRAQFSNDSEFKCAYQHAVTCYEHVRRELDHKLDQLRALDKFAPNAPLPVEVSKRWLTQLRSEETWSRLIDREHDLRQVMNSFVNTVPLKVGDCIAIPARVPHALQHGVRVVEFQTPVYERKILSFAQKVLTQQHWDTADALGVVDMDYSLAAPKVLIHSSGVVVEEIVDFHEFIVQRIKLTQASHSVQCSSYSILKVITGSMNVEWCGGSKRLVEGSAYLMPAFLSQEMSFRSSQHCLFLRAIPVANSRADGF